MPKKAQPKTLQQTQCSSLKHTLSIVGDRWSGVILWSLRTRAQRFVDLQESTQGINPRTLSQRLDLLESEGLIHRREFKEFPPRTEYSITAKGRELATIFCQMRVWAEKNA